LFIVSTESGLVMKS